MVSNRPGSTGEIKPPVPASKAAAVAKIRAAIAQVNITAKKTELWLFALSRQNCNQLPGLIPALLGSAVVGLGTKIAYCLFPHKR